MSNFEKIGRAFVDYYYNVFDQNRSQLGPLYQDNSLLTWEGTKVQGKVNIVRHLEQLPFKRIKHNVTSTDCQPSVSQGVLVMVSGELYVDDQSQPLKYSQVFHLMPSSQNNFYVTNDVLSA